MNYVQHTRAAHERLRTQAGATPHHVSLYWALFFQWNAARFPTALDLDHAATMQAARIGSRHTYRATLRDLDAWSLLAYQPSQSRYEASRCFLLDLSVPDVAQPRPAPGPEVAPMNPRTEATSGPHKTTASGPELPQALRPEVAPMSRSSRPEVAQDTVLDKTILLNSVVVNSAAAAQKNWGEASPPDDEHSERPELSDDSQPPPGAAPKKKVAQKKMHIKHSEGVHADTIRAAAAAQAKSGSPPRRGGAGGGTDLPFAQSTIASLEAFTGAFAGTDYALADLPFYHELVASWRDKTTGEAPRRKDWVATAKRFMLNDARDNRLKLAPGVHRPNAAAGHAGARPTGYRSSRYDS